MSQVYQYQLDAVTELCARLNAEAEAKQIAWSKAVKAAVEMRERLKRLESGT